MPAPSPAHHLDNAIADYVAGESCQVSAARHRVSEARLRAALVKAGLWRTREQVRAVKGAKATQRAVAQSAVCVDDVAKRYRAGESENSIAQSYGVSRNVITRRLEIAGVKRRTMADANRLMMAERTPEENRRNTRAANKAMRGTTVPLERKMRVAATREARQTHISDHERELAKLLVGRGLDVRPQAAIGPYNVDMATGSVAVEVFGGGWHAYGVHRKRTPERLRYILDQGWNLVIVWASLERWPIGEGACDYIEAFAKLASSNPALRGEYRVIWGDGQDATRPGLDVDDLALKPARRGRLRAGPTDDRAG